MYTHNNRLGYFRVSWREWEYTCAHITLLFLSLWLLFGDRNDSQSKSLVMLFRRNRKKPGANNWQFPWRGRMSHSKHFVGKLVHKIKFAGIWAKNNGKQLDCQYTGGNCLFGPVFHAPEYLIVSYMCWHPAAWAEMLTVFLACVAI